MASTPGSTPTHTAPSLGISTTASTPTLSTSPVAALQELVSQSVQTAVSASFDSLMSTLDTRIKAAIGTTPSSISPLSCYHSQPHLQQDPASQVCLHGYLII